MTVHRMQKPLLTIALLLFLLALPRCSGISPLSPTDTLSDLVYAYNHHNFANAKSIYKSCLHPSYTFHFRDEDVGTTVGDYDIPETWTRSKDTVATGLLFDNVQSITLSIPMVDTGLGSPSGESYLVEDVDVDLKVQANPSSSYHAAGRVDIEFRQDEDGNWLIYQLWDDTDDGGQSWGWIKVKFYTSF